MTGRRRTNQPDRPAWRVPVDVEAEQQIAAMAVLSHHGALTALRHCTPDQFATPALARLYQASIDLSDLRLVQHVTPHPLRDSHDGIWRVSRIRTAAAATIADLNIHAVRQLADNLTLTWDLNGRYGQRVADADRRGRRIVDLVAELEELGA